MKKRLLSLLLAVCTTVSLLVLPAEAATVKFSDVQDQTTTTAVEVLRLMGVLDGYGDGSFRPNAPLTRAQFCKMAVYAINGSSELGMHRTVTVFPDVKPSHWAAGYINMAAKGKQIISGYPDGRFYPERKVTVGQAATILLRVLGYKDENVGGVWPDSYMAMAETIGLTEGIRAGGNDVLTRAQAARLFLNLLTVNKAEGGKLYTLSEETDFISVDGGSGTIKTSDETYTMVHPTDSSSLAGTRGRVVLAGEKALTFLPSSTGSSGVASTAVIIYADGSSAGLDALAGNRDYTIYKNGTRATTADLRKNDVATYYAATNSILVCDTRVSVYYEDCAPNPSAPTRITAMGHEFPVLPVAQESLSKFKPGQQMIILLTTDGQVAAAVDVDSGVRGNAVGVVQSGSVQMFCGTTMLPLKGQELDDVESRVVRLSSSKKGELNLNRVSGTVYGDLKVTERKLGSKHLTENVVIYRDGKLITLNQLANAVVPRAQILYARTNWAGEVDLLVLKGALDDATIYGRAYWIYDQDTVEVTDKNGREPGEDGYVSTTKTVDRSKMGVEYGDGKRTEAYNCGYNVKSGEFVGITLNAGKTAIVGLERLSKLGGVSNSAWIGDTAVTFGGKTYTVDPDTLLCYNGDSRNWITLDRAREYADKADLYARDGMIIAMEVKS